MRHRQLAGVALWILLVATLGLAPRASGQDASGRIIGTVYDPQGAVIPGAKVTVINSGTQDARHTTTDNDGYFQVLDLPIGSYQVTAEHEGFQTLTTEPQKLLINQVLRFDVKMLVGTTSQTVTVEATVAGVETVNATLGQSVTSRQLVNLPLNGRNVLDLALLQPGVTEAGDDYTGAAPGNNGGAFSIAGGRPDSITFLLDGGVNNDLLDNSDVFNPNPDTVQEFRILTSNYTAEYGRNGGGIISVVTKSGTNSYHGDVFEFLRNDALNANKFFNNLQGLPRDVLKRHQFGGTLGGPITIPHLIQGRDRFFFFAGYQGQRQTATENVQSAGVANTAMTTVFTPQELMGNFSGDAGVAAFLQSNPFFQSNPALAAQGIIDPTKINIVAQNYIAAGLIPTSPTGVLTPIGTATDNRNELTMKFDFIASEQDRIALTLGGGHSTTLNPFVFSTVGGSPDTNIIRDSFANLGYTHTFSPSLLNEFRITVQRSDSHTEQPAAHLPTPAALGIGITPDNPVGPTNLLFDTGLATGFSENGPTRLVDNTIAYSDTLTWVRGKHTYKMGVGISSFQNNTVFDFIVDGEFDFTGAGGIGSGNGFADFLLGIPNAYFQSPQAPSNIRSQAFYGFFQDDWKLLKNLSVSLGLRYEYSTPKLDTAGRSYSISPGRQSVVFPNAPVGLLFPGDPGAPRGANFPAGHDWGPRFGFAWDIFGDGKTSLRGGVGIFYDILKGEDNLQFNGQPPFFGGAGLFFNPVTGDTNSPITYLTDPYGSAGIANSFPSMPPAPNVNFANAGFLPIDSSAVQYFVDPHLYTPYIYHYNLSLQRELARQLVLELSYVGSDSHGLTALQDINPFVLGTADRILNLTPGNSTCNTSGGLCSFATIPEFRNVSFASYNSLEASLQRTVAENRYLGTTYFILAYTLAHNIDNASGFQNRNFQVPAYNAGQFRASADSDVRHRVTLSGGWDLPLDRAFAGAPKRLTRGWSVYPIFSWRTGFPLDVPARLSNRFDFTLAGPSGAGDPTLINANLTGPITILNPRANGNFWFAPGSFSNAQNADSIDPNNPCAGDDPALLPSNNCAIANPAVRTYGSLPRNAFRSPGRANMDFAVAKTTNITESVKAEFRAEMFNVLNHAQFRVPDTNITDATFGQVTDTYDPRIIQLALRISF